MSNQSKVTDFFTVQKKTDNTFRSIDKKMIITTDLTDNETIVDKKTPKRKKVVTNDIHLRSSKRKKTPKTNPNIEIKTKNETTIDLKNEKQLTANEVKERLVKCSNLLELKKQLSKINDCAAKVKQFKEIKVKSPAKKPLRTPTKPLKSPLVSPNRPIVSNRFRSPVLSLTPNKDQTSGKIRRNLFDVFEDQKSSPEAINKTKGSLRAFERFNYLVDNSEESRSLVLPIKFKILAEMFKSMDTITSMHYKRHEICTFDKLKESVERMTSKKFDTKKLAQIQTVLSNAFKLNYNLMSSSLDNRKPSYQLVITPLYNSNVDIRKNSAHLLERYQLFVSKLLDITKRYHKKYLNDMGIAVDEKDMVRWHPKFRLDLVPDIVINDNALPPQPVFGEQSAELYLEKTRQRLGLTTETTDEIINTNDNQLDKPITDSNKKVTKGVLKGISMDLLNKIRAKEAANLVKEMTRKPEVENEIRILRSIPEFVRIIHSFFIASKKLAVLYDELIDKVINSYTSSLSILRAREHVDYMCQFLPDWIYTLEVKKGNYIKINKDMTLSKLDDRIEQRINHLKQ